MKSKFNNLLINKIIPEWLEFNERDPEDAEKAWMCFSDYCKLWMEYNNV